MTPDALLRLLRKDQPDAVRGYALVDSAATAGYGHWDDICHRLEKPRTRSQTLFTGAKSWRVKTVAPCLVPLDTQPELTQWLLDHPFSRSHTVYLTSDAAEPDLLAHLRRYFALRAKNGRTIYFRYYDPLILHDFLSTLTPEHSAQFFGPISRWLLLHDENTGPLTLDKPGGVTPSGLPPSQLVLSKRDTLARTWRQHLMPMHADAYSAKGLETTADAQNNRLTLKEKDGSQATLEKTRAGVTITTGADRTFAYELSLCKNPTAITDPAGNRIDLDLQERENIVTGHKDSLLQAVRMAHHPKSWVLDYDAMNHLQCIDYPDHTRVQLAHDSYGNLTRYTDRNGHTSTYERDHQERLTRHTDANGHATGFDYQDHQAPSRIGFADGHTFDFAYTDAGRLRTLIANDQRVADYTVDEKTGSWQVNYTDGTWAGYDIKDQRIVKASNPAGTVALTYDEHGRLASERFKNQTVTYKRNPSGQLSGIITPDGQQLVFERDAEQRITTLVDWSGRRTRIHYAPNGALESIDYPNRTRLQQNTNSDGLPEHMQLHPPDAKTPYFQRRIQRDPLNRVTRIDDTGKSIHYTYDRQGRLTSARSQHPEYQETFTLDAKANRLTDQRGSYTYTHADRIVQPGHAYDPVGNLTQGQTPQGHAQLQWKSANRLTQTTINGQNTRYSYDAFGRRVEKITTTGRTRTIWAGDQPLQEIITNADGQRTVDYLFLPNTCVLLALRDRNLMYYAAFGHRYETLSLTDANGELAWLADYDAFGNAHIEKGHPLYQPFRLAGHYLDPETGLHYNKARYYDPQMGRYLSLDPLFLQGGSENFYTYCNADPINTIDPNGEFIFIPILIGAALGAAIGAGLEYYRQKQTGPDTDGYKIAKAALIGGAIGAVGGGVGAAVEGAMAASAAGTVLAKSALATMAATGFLSGTAASVSEQCTEAAIKDQAIPPLEITKQALTDGMVGAVIGLATFGSGGIVARRARKAVAEVAENPVFARLNVFKQKAKAQVADASPQAHHNAARNADHLKTTCVGEPINAVKGEVILTQTDFDLPGHLPLSWTRHYGSQNPYDGLLGPGWQTPADARLQLDKAMVTFHDGSPGGAVFEHLPGNGAALMELANGAVLTKQENSYQVRLKSGVTYHFGPDFENGINPVYRISDPDGHHLTFSRNEGLLTAIKDSSGRTLRIQTEQGRISAMHYQDRRLVAYHYQDGRLVSAIDPMGHARRFAYDLNGRMIRHTDRNHVSFHYEYDDRNRCVHSFGDNGLYDYRLEYPLFERRTNVTNSLGHTTEYHYDSDRLPIKVVDPTGAAVTYTYDAVGRIIEVADALEQTTTYKYDAAGNLLEITRPDRGRMAFAYDDHHRPLQIMDPNDYIWEHAYDPKGRLISKTSPMGHTTRYTYGPFGDLTEVIDPEGRTTGFDYTPDGLLKTLIQPSGRRTHFHRNLLGDITAAIDPAGTQTRYSYDEKGRLLTAQSPGGLSQHFEWDPEDNLLLHTDAAGHQTRFTYTGLNEIAQRINADDTRITYQYDTEEQLTALINERGQTHRFEYDPAGRLNAQTDYYGNTHRYTFDPAGQMIQSLDPLNQIIQYAYDPAGRLKEKLYENGESAVFNHDRAGNLISFDSPAGRTERLIDPDGRLIEEKSGGFIAQYQYDQSNLRTERTSSAGNQIRYAHDPDGRVAQIFINDDPPITFDRNTAGQITTEHLGKQLKRHHGYDDEGRIIHQRIASPTQHIERRFEYDQSGNLTARHDSHKGTWRFNYDPLGRIIQSLNPLEQVHQHLYDPAGDILEHLPDAQNGLRGATHEGTTYRFDAAGNLKETQETDEPTTEFEWDPDNRLAKIITPTDQVIRMTHDALGRRTRKSVNGKRTFFTWDGDTLLTERFEDQGHREYIYRPGTFEPLAAIEPDGRILFYHNDINGLPLELTTAEGTLVWSAAYDAFGRIQRLLVDEVKQPLRMQGQYFDEEIGLCYNRYRYYDPKICSFISQDPIGLVGGENVYAYGPNVWGWVDPLGLACKQSNRDFKNFSKFSDYFKDIGNRKYRRDLYFNHYLKDPKSFFSRDKIQDIQKLKGDLPYTLDEKIAFGKVKIDAVKNWMKSDSVLPNTIQFAGQFLWAAFTPPQTPPIFDTKWGKKADVASVFLGNPFKKLIGV
ncbi:MAG: DUF4123 domain-containing protein [Desulfatitalea sp.]|nr:RHS domain-containing protein [Desulfatitalea sp.]NNJ99589.1 DUF4123 domain-containing protein [Desulfatitalea sp.]